MLVKNQSKIWSQLWSIAQRVISSARYVHRTGRDQQASGEMEISIALDTSQKLGLFSWFGVTL